MARPEQPKPHIRHYKLDASTWVWGVFLGQNGRRPVAMTAEFSNLRRCKIFNRESKRGTHQA